MDAFVFLLVAKGLFDPFSCGVEMFVIRKLSNCTARTYPGQVNYSDSQS